MWTRSLDEVADRALAHERMTARLATLFAAFAIVLTTIGLYGTIAYHTYLRTREIGIRMAVGARRLDVMLSVARPGAAVVIAGLAGGLLASHAVTLAFARTFTGLGADAPSIAAGVVATVLASAAALAVPASRASRLDPSVALRSQ